jgi:hypothetical protein
MFMRSATPRPIRYFLAAFAATSLSCSDETKLEPFVENVDIALCDPARGGYTLDITNPYFPLAVGSQSVLEGSLGGVLFRVVITVLDSTLDVAGVTTRVVEEVETENAELVEDSRNFFVQAVDGTVCYYGEDVDVYENGVIVDHPGQWRAGVNGAVPGILMPAAPAVGQAFRQEVAVGVAEDRSQFVAMNELMALPGGTFHATLRSSETTPLEPGHISRKAYGRGAGLIVDNLAVLVSRAP